MSKQVITLNQTPAANLQLFALARAGRLKRFTEGDIPTYAPQPLNKTKEMERRRKQMERKKEKDARQFRQFMESIEKMKRFLKDMKVNK